MLDQRRKKIRFSIEFSSSEISDRFRIVVGDFHCFFSWPFFPRSFSCDRLAKRFSCCWIICRLLNYHFRHIFSRSFSWLNYSVHETGKLKNFACWIENFVAFGLWRLVSHSMSNYHFATCEDAPRVTSIIHRCCVIFVFSFIDRSADYMIRSNTMFSLLHEASQMRCSSKKKSEIWIRLKWQSSLNTSKETHKFQTISCRALFPIKFRWLPKHFKEFYSIHDDAPGFYALPHQDRSGKQISVSI